MNDLKALRDEAANLKDCFTRYSFQTISVSLVALGIVGRTQGNSPEIGLVSLLVILLVLTVMRMGVHKYLGANRLYGFELHTARLDSLDQSVSDIPFERLKSISWEEAMRAWRIVQPTMFATLYDLKPIRSIRLLPSVPRLKTRFVQQEKNWFQVSSLIESGSTYFTGSYLRTIFFIFFMIIGFASISLIYMAYQVFKDPEVSNLIFVLAVALPFVVIPQAGLRCWQLTERRRILDDGMHSIHSSAICWHFVTVAHFRALTSMGADDDYKVATLNGYSAALSTQAREIVRFMTGNEEIYKWLRPEHATGLPE